MSENTLSGALHDPDSEREFIGGILRRPEAVEAYLDHAGIADLFRDRRCEDAWAAITSLAGDGEPVTVPSVRATIAQTAHHFANNSDVMAWLMSASSEAPSTLAEISASFDRVDRARKNRTLHDFAAQVRNLITEPGADPDEILGHASNQLATMEAATNGRGDLVLGDQAISSTIEGIFHRRDNPGLRGIPTGSKDLDDLTGGLVDGRLIIIAARPAGGKSVAGLDLVRAALRSGAAAIINTLEMAADEVMLRLLSAEGSITNKSLQDGTLTPEEEERLAQAAAALPWERLAINDTPNLTSTQIIAQAAPQIRRWRAQGIEKAVLVVDYLQIMDHTIPGKRTATRQQEIGNSSRALKNGAKTLHVPVVALAQMGRSGADREPRLEDLRESGDIENDADQVIMLDRPSQRNVEDRPGEIDYWMRKNRHGQSGIAIPRAEQFHLSRVSDLASGY